METEKKRLTATEREALMRINLALSLILTEEGNLRNRNKLIRRGGTYLGAARGLMARYVDEFYRTVPVEQLKSVYRAVKDTTYTVGVRCPATRDKKRDKEYGVVVPIGALNALFAACGDHCLMCMGNREEQGKCPLRKALDAIPNDVSDRNDGRCPYQGVLIHEAEEASSER